MQVARTAVNADGQTVLTKDPDPQAYTNDYVTKAVELLKAEGVDVVGQRLRADRGDAQRRRQLTTA